MEVNIPESGLVPRKELAIFGRTQQIDDLARRKASRNRVTHHHQRICDLRQFGFTRVRMVGTNAAHKPDFWVRIGDLGNDMVKSGIDRPHTHIVVRFIRWHSQNHCPLPDCQAGR